MHRRGYSRSSSVGEPRREFDLQVGQWNWFSLQRSEMFIATNLQLMISLLQRCEIPAEFQKRLLRSYGVRAQNKDRQLQTLTPDGAKSNNVLLHLI